MPRYFFNVYDSRAFIDDVGSDLPDERAMRREAVHALSDLLKRSSDTVDNLSDGQWRMIVTDETGREVLAFLLSGWSKTITSREVPHGTGMPPVPH